MIKNNTFTKKIKEIDIIKIFVRLFIYKYPKFKERLIRIENSSSRYNAADRIGQVKGTADFLFDVESADKQYRNLWIEFKAGYNKQQPAQIEFEQSCKRFKSNYIICYTAEDALLKITEHLTYLEPIT